LSADHTAMYIVLLSPHADRHAGVYIG